jgi:hypothetical protein
MPGRPAVSSDASSPRLLVLDGETAHDVFDLLAITGDVIRVRSALLFEVGEELTLRIEQDGSAWDTTARVRAHVPATLERITELEISSRTPARRTAAG